MQGPVMCASQLTHHLSWPIMAWLVSTTAKPGMNEQGLEGELLSNAEALFSGLKKSVKRSSLGSFY